MRRVALVFVGGVLGLVGARYVLVGSAWSLLPWGLVALLAGILARSRRAAVTDGALYGFVLSFVFMVAGYSGTARLTSRLPFFLLLGLFGAACAAAIALVGRLLRSSVRKAH